MLQLKGDKERSLAKPWLGERRGALLSLVLGLAEVFGASLGTTLLFQTGLTKLARLVVTLTGLCRQ